MEYKGANKIVNEIQPLVSVSVQTYQHGGFIKQCIEGILMQKTDFAFEIIIGEDESTDETRAICIDYAEKHQDKIRLFLRSRKDVVYINGTPTGRYNFLKNLEAARGKYIAVCEGDDYWSDENKLQKQVDFMEGQPRYAICFHRVNELEENGELRLSNGPMDKAQVLSIEDLAKGNMIYTPSVLFRNGLIRSFPEWINQSPVLDYILHMLNAKHGLIQYFPEPMAVYRKHAGGIWSSLQRAVLYERWAIVTGLLLREDFEPKIKEALLTQKRNNTEWCLLEYMNENTWEQFLEKLALFSKDDQYISEKWLLEHYPRFISSYTNSRSFKITKSFMGTVKKFLR